MMTDDKLAVTQEDRERAADWLAAQGSWGGTGVTLAMRRGERDNHSLVQAFARFEAQARLAGERAGMERAAGIAASFEVLSGGPVKSGFDLAKGMIADAILKEAASITQTED